MECWPSGLGRIPFRRNHRPYRIQTGQTKEKSVRRSSTLRPSSLPRRNAWHQNRTRIHLLRKKETTDRNHDRPTTSRSNHDNHRRLSKHDRQQKNTDRHPTKEMRNLLPFTTMHARLDATQNRHLPIQYSKPRKTETLRRTKHRRI